MSSGGIFGHPGGQVKVEVPDGVTRTFGEGEAKNSLTNSAWACGGSFGGSYGAFPIESHDGTGTASVIFCGPGNRDRFKIG